MSQWFVQAFIKCIQNIPINKKHGFVAGIIFTLFSIGVNGVDLPLIRHNLDLDFTPFIMYLLFWVPAIYQLFIGKKNKYFFFWLGYTIGLVFYRINSYEPWVFFNYSGYLSIEKVFSCLAITIVCGFIFHALWWFMSKNNRA